MCCRRLGTDSRLLDVNANQGWTGMDAPDICVLLPGADRDRLQALLHDIGRHGFERVLLVDGLALPASRDVDRGVFCERRAEDMNVIGFDEKAHDVAQTPVSAFWHHAPAVETVTAAGLPSALGSRAGEPGATVLVIDGGRMVGTFNWLDLVPRLAARPDAPAILALLADGGPAAALVRRDGMARLSPSAPLTVAEAGLPAFRYLAAARSAESCRPAVFFDRDGVINADHGYVGDASRFDVLPGAIAGVKAANDRGALTFLVTNQSGVARGYYTEQDVAELHRHMNRALRREGAHFDDIRICPHLPDAEVPAYRLHCRCRKPAPGMLLDLMERWRVDRGGSVMIGDKASDMAAARAAGLRGVLYAGGALADLVIPALAQRA